MKCIVEGSSTGIPVQNMKDGELAEIISWGSYTEERKGIVIQRVEGKLIRIGKPVGKSWSAILNSNQTGCRVRLLKAGETIRLVEEKPEDLT